MKITLKTQLRFMSLLTVLLLGGIIAFSSLNLRTLQSEFNNYQLNRDNHQAMIEIKAAALSISRADPILAETEISLKKVNKHIQQLFAEANKSMGTTVHSKALKAAHEFWNDYNKGIAGAIKIAEESPVDALSIPDAMYKLKLFPMVEKLDAMAAALEKSDKETRQLIDNTMSRILKVIIIPLLIVAAIVVIFQQLFAVNLQRRIAGIIAVMDKLRDGDLRHRLPVTHGRDEITHMSNVINAFIDHFANMLNNVKQAATTTEETVHNVEEMTKKANRNAKTQADRFFQVSVAIEQITQTLAEMVNTVENANMSASETHSTVSRGNRTGQETISALMRIESSMNDSGKTIDELHGAMERIGNVSDIIRGVAEQTNLLALNAAIEAARAGEHGRGFAVVADEVRTLATRTADSINDITEIVATIQEGTKRVNSSMAHARDEVQSGVKLGEEMRKLLTDIDTSVHQVSEMMLTIAAATEEQSATSNEIARNVEEVNVITDSTRRDIEATRNAVGTLVDVAGQLRGHVEQFQLAANNVETRE